MREKTLDERCTQANDRVWSLQRRKGEGGSFGVIRWQLVFIQDTSLTGLCHLGSPIY